MIYNKHNARIHRFQPKLSESERVELDQLWIPLFRQIYPKLISAQPFTVDCSWQRKGVDWVLFVDEKDDPIYVDGKIRSEKEAYRDIALEIYSQAQVNWKVYTKYQQQYNSSFFPCNDLMLQALFPEREIKQLGWAIDDTKISHFIAYVVPKCRLCYWIPYQSLREVTKMFWQEWAMRTRGVSFPIIALNEGYHNKWQTINIGITWYQLCRELKMKYEKPLFWGRKMELPKSYQIDKQLIFEWGESTIFFNNSNENNNFHKIVG